MAKRRELSKRCDCAESTWPKCRHGWYVRKMVRGTRLFFSIDQWLGHEKTRTVADAEKVLEIAVAAARAGVFSPLGPPDSPAVRRGAPLEAGMWTFGAVLDRYFTSFDDDPTKSDQYRADRRARLNPAAAWPVPPAYQTRGISTLADVPIAAVTTELLEVFIRSRAALGRSVNLRNKLLQEHRRLGRWSVKKGYRPTTWLEKDDTDLKYKKPHRRSRRLALADGQTPAEEERLLAVAPPHLRALIVVALEIGARSGELLGMTWRDVDLARGAIVLRGAAKGSDSDVDRVIPVRSLPISARLRPVLVARQTAPDGERLPVSAFVFGNEVGERVKSVRNKWQDCVLRAHGVDPKRRRPAYDLSPDARTAYRSIDLKFHDLRHEAASRWLEAGWPLHKIQAMLGHADLATTAIYLNVRAGDLHAQMAEFDADRAADGPTWEARQTGDASTLFRRIGAKVVQMPQSRPRQTPAARLVDRRKSTSA